MSVLQQATGIVLHRVRHGETSLILTAFTREMGKLGLMAKGARAKGKLGGSAGLELFTEAQFVFYRKSGRDLQLLKEWATISPHSVVREDFERLTIASAVVELLARCLTDEDPHPDLYDAASATLHALDQRPESALPLLWAFETSLFQTLGFGLQTELDALTGRPLTPPFPSYIRYRWSSGSFFVSDPRNNPPSDGEMSGETFAVLSALSQFSVQAAGQIAFGPRVRKELTYFLSRYLETHLPVRGKIRSLEALNWGEPEQS
ncbi:MAG TPA: DNA repair protein RecO [bacterium]|jgi:DNA repair protein RecO (recombination protein O)